MSQSGKALLSFDDCPLEMGGQPLTYYSISASAGQPLVATAEYGVREEWDTRAAVERNRAFRLWTKERQRRGAAVTLGALGAAPVYDEWDEYE